jgi:integrase
MRYQRGYLYKRSGAGAWRLRYLDHGKKKSWTIGRELSKSEARRLADEFLKPLNSSDRSGSMTLEQFVEQEYLPFVLTQHRASTIHEYNGLWKRYLKAKAQIGLQQFRTSDGERILNAIAGELSVTTLKHVKAFLSGTFRYALRVGKLDGHNPMSAVAIPKAKPPRETLAYDLEEISHLLAVLPEPDATIVAVAAFTGLRRGEIRGLQWGDYSGQELKVKRARWRDTVSDPKTRKSKAPVPVIPQLAERLNAHRAKGAGIGLIFEADLDLIARKHRIQWHGFRRGLATNLHQLEVSDLVIQRILRHSNVAVTQACYIKAADKDAREAMGRLAGVLG